MSLLAYRKKAQLSQRELARMSGVTQQLVSLIERSDSPNVELKTARAFVRALNTRVKCSLDQVFPSEGKRSADPSTEAA